MRIAEFLFLTALFIVRLVTKYFEIPISFQFILYLLFIFYYIKQPVVEFIRLILFNFLVSSFVIGLFIPLEINYVSFQLIFIMLFKIMTRKFNFTFKNQFWFVLLFFYFFFISFLTEMNGTDFALFHSRYQMIVFAGVFLIFTNVTLVTNTFLTSSVIVYALALSSIFIIVLNFFGINFSDREVVELGDNAKLSISSALPDRNYSSGLISFGIGILLIEMNKIKDKWFVFLLIIIFLGSQLILASRGGIITSILIFLFYLVNSSLNKGKSFLSFLYLVFPIVFSLLLFDTSRLEDRLEEGSLQGQSGRSEIREESFTNYINQKSTDVIFGGGSFHGYLSLANNKSIHNNFLEILYDYGIIGLGIFFLVVSNVWRMQLFNKMIILIYCVVSLSLSPIISVVFWVLLVISFRPYRSINNNIETVLSPLGRYKI